MMDNSDNPFQLITDAFAPEYRVNLSIQGLDGSIMLTLSNESGVVAKRLISALQRYAPKRLQRLTESVQFRISIQQGHRAVTILEAISDQDFLKQLAAPPPLHNRMHIRPNLAVGLCHCAS